MKHERLATEESNQPLTSVRSSGPALTGIKKELAEQDEVETRLSEKITPPKACMFICYYICLIESIILMVNVPETVANNLSLSLTTTNSIIRDNGYAIVDEGKEGFHDIKTLNDFASWFVSGFLYTLYTPAVGFQSFDYVADNNTFLYFQTISPVRFTIRRSKHVDLSGDSSVYPRKWIKDQSEDDTAQYGKNGFLFNYSSNEKGYVYKIPVSYQSRVNTLKEFNALLQQSGFFENYMKELKLDVVVFNKVNYYFSFIQAKFDFSPSGIVRKKDLQIFSYPAEPYQKPGDPALPVFQVLFTLIFFYYFFQEFVKIYVQIKNAFLNSKMSGSGNLALNAANVFRQKIINVLKGLLNHIKDPLTFVNLVTIIFSFYIIFNWVDYRFNSEIPGLIQDLGLKEGAITNLDFNKRQIFLSLNQKIEDQASQLKSIYQISTFNMIVLTIKCINYLAFLYQPMQSFQSNFSSLINKNIPLILYTFSLMLSFAVFIYFFFGRFIEEFQDGYWSILNYFFINLNNQMDYVDEMFEIDEILTILFVFIFGIFGNFIMIAMFQIFSVSAYEEHHKKLAKKKPKVTQDSDAHFTYQLKMFVIRDFRIWLYSFWDISKAAKIRDHFQQLEKQTKLEMTAYKAFDFDLGLETQNPEAKKLKVYRNERTNFKLIRNKKAEYIKVIWATIFTVSLTIVFLAVSLEHHKIADGRSMVSSASQLFESKSVMSINDQGRKVLTSTNISLDGFQKYQDVINWMRLFQAFGDQQTYTLASGQVFNGFFFGGVNYLLTDSYRMTIRKSYVVHAPDSVYNSISSTTISGSFDPLDKDPPGEYKEPITGLVSGTVYNFTKKGSYQDLGGYVVYSPINKILTTFNDSINDHLIDNVMNSMVIDWPIYQPTSFNLLYGFLSLVLDDSFNLKMEYKIDLVPLNYYRTNSQRFIAFLEICIFVSFFVYGFALYSAIRKKYVQYNLWHSLHVAYFPELMLKQRRRKEPEIFRRLKHVFSFKEFTDLLFLTFLFTSIVLWIVYLALISDLQKQVDYYLANDDRKNYTKFADDIHSALGILNTSKVFEALLLMVICIKIVNDLAFFKSFKFLVNTMSKSIKDLITLLVVLIFYLLAFTFFLNINLGQKFEDFKNIGEVLCLVLQIISGMNSRLKIQLFTYNPIKVVSTIFFYIPFLFAIIFIIKYTYLAVLTHYYRVAKYEMEFEDELHFSISFAEFFKLTFDMLRRRQKKTKVSFHISDQVVYDVKMDKIFDEFRETVELKDKLANMSSWATHCSKDIVKEYENRKRVKKYAKEMTQTRLANDLTEGTDQVKQDIQSRLLEMKMRLKYWDYFRAGNLRLLEFMIEFKNWNLDLEKKTGDPDVLKTNKTAEMKIKKYILYLEKQNSQNITLINMLTSQLNKYSRVSLTPNSIPNL